MSRLRQCKHYGYGNGMICGKGVSLKRFSFATAPCFPRNASTPCEHREWITQEEIDEKNAEFDEEFAMVLIARALIVETGRTFGHVECPECHGKLRFCTAYNGHIRAACETAGCIRWME